jgi:hypothetical protein
VGIGPGQSVEVVSISSLDLRMQRQPFGMTGATGQTAQRCDGGVVGWWQVAALLQSDMHTDFCDYTLTNWHQAVHAAGHTATTNAKPRLLLS